MKIHLVSGKGGVGKSLFSLGLARYFSSLNKRVLLAELGEQSFFSHLLDLPQLNYQPITLANLKIDLARWDGASALSEYVRHLLKVESLHKLFFENAITKSLIDAAPGLKELAILGKITSGPPRHVGPKLNYDVLVIDAFSSGHFFALLKAPMGMAETFRFGPMAEQSRGIMKTLNSPDLTQIHVVTLPEELPFQETCEMIQDLPKVTSLRPTLWINKWIDYPDMTLYPHFKDIDKIFREKERLQTYYLDELNKLSPCVRKIPLYYELEVLTLSQKFSEEIKL